MIHKVCCNCGAGGEDPLCILAAGKFLLCRLVPGLHGGRRCYWDSHWSPGAGGLAWLVVWDGLVEPCIRAAPSPEHPFLLHHVPAADASSPPLGRHKYLKEEGVNLSSIVMFSAEGFLKCTAGSAYCPANLELLACRQDTALISSCVPSYCELADVTAACCLYGSTSVCNACAVGFSKSAEVDAFFPSLVKIQRHSCVVMGFAEMYFLSLFKAV